MIRCLVLGSFEEDDTSHLLYGLIIELEASLSEDHWRTFLMVPIDHRFRFRPTEVFVLRIYLQFETGGLHIFKLVIALIICVGSHDHSILVLLIVKFNQFNF